MAVFLSFLFLVGLNVILCEEDFEHAGTLNDDTTPETWDAKDYSNWEEQELSKIEEDATVRNEDSTWQMPQEERDDVLYDLYDKQPEIILEVDEDGLELSDSWVILDTNEQELDESETDYVNNEEFLKDDDLEETGFLSTDMYHETECEDINPEKKVRRTKSSTKPRNEDEFYFKHKTYGKKRLKKGSAAVKIPNWKQNCCIRGKRVGNGRRTFMSKNIFQECKDRTRNLASRMSRSCKWIFWSCCEARALRRYYVHHQSSQKDFC